MLSVWAYGYTYAESLVGDEVYDREAPLVDLTIDTDRPDLDAWFRANYHDYTGSWIGEHPELDKVKLLYERILRLRDAVDRPPARKRKPRKV